MVTMLFAGLLGVASALAMGAQPMPSDAERSAVASTVARYVNAIACGGVRVMPADVLLLSTGYRDGALARYAVLWTGDLACAGGAGSDKTHLAIATYNAGQFVVQPALSSPVVAFESPVRTVTRVVRYSARIMVLEGREAGPGDRDDAPTVPVRFMLRVDGKGNWVLVDKVFLANPAD